mmetsp:Transcript_129711/g.225344  ORF Transcript_129711/g.225344 Transcript_129711/m.225344 type:complete len:220 (-) Transcript_129711:176-835(-)
MLIKQLQENGNIPFGSSFAQLCNHVLLLCRVYTFPCLFPSPRLLLSLSFSVLLIFDCSLRRFGSLPFGILFRFLLLCCSLLLCIFLFLSCCILDYCFFGIGHWFLVMFFLLLLALLVRNYFNNICLHHSSLDSLSSCLVICLAYQRSLFGLFRRQCCRCVKLHHPRPRMNIHLCGLDHAFAPCLRCRDICSSCTWHHALVVLELRWLGRLLRCLLVARL